MGKTGGDIPDARPCSIVHRSAESKGGAGSIYDIKQLSRPRQIQQLLHWRRGIHQARHALAFTSQVADCNQGPQPSAIDERRMRQIDFHIRVFLPRRASRFSETLAVGRGDLLISHNSQNFSESPGVAGAADENVIFHCKERIVQYCMAGSAEETFRFRNGVIDHGKR